MRSQRHGEYGSIQLPSQGQQRSQSRCICTKDQQEKREQKRSRFSFLFFLLFLSECDRSGTVNTDQFSFRSKVSDVHSHAASVPKINKRNGSKNVLVSPFSFFSCFFLNAIAAAR